MKKPSTKTMGLTLLGGALTLGTFIISALTEKNNLDEVKDNLKNDDEFRNELKNEVLKELNSDKN